MKITSKKIAETLVDKINKAHSKEMRSEVIKNFARLLQQEGKISRLKDITDFFSRSWNKKHKEIDVYIESATEGKIHLPTHVGDYKLNIVQTTKPELIAGVNISFGDYTVSKTLKKDLLNLKA